MISRTQQTEYIQIELFLADRPVLDLENIIKDFFLNQLYKSAVYSSIWRSDLSTWKYQFSQDH